MYYSTYDVTEDETRESVIQILKDAGLIRIQKSVFCGNISNQQKKDIIEKIHQVIDKETDSFYLIMNCKQCFSKMVMIGRNFDVEYAQGDTPSMVF